MGDKAAKLLSGCSYGRCPVRWLFGSDDGNAPQGRGYNVKAEPAARSNGRRAVPKAFGVALKLHCCIVKTPRRHTIGAITAG